MSVLGTRLPVGFGVESLELAHQRRAVEGSGGQTTEEGWLPCTQLAEGGPGGECVVGCMRVGPPASALTSLNHCRYVCGASPSPRASL